jgi:hypothetical protein
MAARPPPTLEFRPCAGLANRLRALVSAICAAEDIGWRLRVWWPIEHGIHTAPFSLLFKLPESLPPFVAGVEEEWHTASELLVRNDAEWAVAARRLQNEPGMAKLPPYLKSYYQFHSADPARWLRHLRALKPHDIHLKRVSAVLAAAHGGPLIGVHIRRTDNAVSKANSPTQLFIHVMRQALTAHPTMKFFVASDDDAERRTLRATFGDDRILTLAGRLDRTSIEGGVEAFLDFLALSQCQEIWGSVHSSFCELAAQYGGVGYIQIGVPTQTASVSTQQQPPPPLAV